MQLTGWQLGRRSARKKKKKKKKREEEGGIVAAQPNTGPESHTLLPNPKCNVNMVLNVRGNHKAD